MICASLSAQLARLSETILTDKPYSVVFLRNPHPSAQMQRSQVHETHLDSRVDGRAIERVLAQVDETRRIVASR